MERAIRGKFLLPVKSTAYLRFGVWPKNSMTENPNTASERAARYEEVYKRVFDIARDENFAGYDPFDGLESRIFKAIPILNHFALIRMAWLQSIKRLPINLRRMLGVPRGINPKGVALFALAEAARIRDDLRGTDNLSYLLELLDRLAILEVDGSGSRLRSFGYNFDWQSRAFYAPKLTPTIVPTAFAAKAYLDGYELLGSAKFLEAADEICRFILNRLRRPFETATEICFSYTPNDNSRILNASLLAGEVLARTGELVGRTDYLETALKTARFVVGLQSPEGSWPYGTRLRHKWVDNFHTAFMISSLLALYDKCSSLLERDESEKIFSSIDRGTNFWIDNFFLASAAPKYFHNRTNPIDIHSAAAAIVTLADLAETRDDAIRLACRIADWTLENMYYGGRFFYQKNALITVRIEFIRWGQAWMAFALSRLAEVIHKKAK